MRLVACGVGLLRPALRCSAGVIRSHWQCPAIATGVRTNRNAARQLRGCVRVVRVVRMSFADTGSTPTSGIERTTSLQPIPYAAPAAVLLQMVALGQVTEVLLQRVAVGSGQFDGIHHRDASVLAGEFHDLQ